MGYNSQQKVGMGFTTSPFEDFKESDLYLDTKTSKTIYKE